MNTLLCSNVVDLSDEGFSHTVVSAGSQSATIYRPIDGGQAEIFFERFGLSIAPGEVGQLRCLLDKIERELKK